MTKTLAAGALALGLLAASAAFAQTPPAPAGASAAAAAATKAPAAAATVGTTTTTTTTTTTVAVTPPGPKAKYTSATSLKTLMADPASKAVLTADIPMVVDFLEMAGDMLPDEFTVDVLHDMFGDQSGVDDAMVKKINADLAKI